VLVILDLDRIGREQIAVSSVLKKITDAGVRVFEYSKGTEIKLDGAMDKIMLGLKGFAAEVEREQARARARAIDSGLAKFKRGEATGPACYGYRSVNVLRDGSRTAGKVAPELRAYAVHEIEPVEAATVKRIFELTRDGEGRQRIAGKLNAQGIKSAKSKKWCAATVRHILDRETYRGLTVYGQQERKYNDGAAKVIDRAEPLASLVREDLRIVSDDLGNAAQSARASREGDQLRAKDGKLDGHPAESPYLLTKFTKCSECGASLYVKDSGPRKDGSRKAVYRCVAARTVGRCSATQGLDVAELDATVLRLVDRELLQADVIEKALDAELAAAGDIAAERERVTVELAEVQAEINRLVSARASGAAFEAINAGLKDREAVKQGLQARAEHLQGRARAAQVDREALRETLTLWRGKLAPSQVAVSRQVLAKLLPERIKVNLETGAFSGPASFGYLISMGKSWSDARPSVTPRA
jgi:site-specific DNA recombinase